MKTFQAVAAWIGSFAGIAASRLRQLLRFLFGSVNWTPPRWLSAGGRALRGVCARLLRWRAAHPAAAAMTGALLVVVVVGAGFGWRWYQNRPRPVTVGYTVQAPPRTCYECEPPGNEPQPLRIRFSASVAPMLAIGKAVDPTMSGIHIDPAIDGAWRWTDDRELEFRPKADWPVGQRYHLEFARQGFVAPQIRLSDYRTQFSSAAFEAHVGDTEFYQDPVTATDKKAVVTIAFSHPVDTADFPGHVKLTLYNKLTDTLEQPAGTPRFTVLYDKLKLHAYIHSEQLSVPAKQGRLAVEIAPGLHAAAGGNRTGQPLKASVDVPGLFALKVNGIRLNIARSEKDEPQQVLLVNTSYSVTEKEMTGHVKAWLLPEKNPDAQAEAAWSRYNAGKPYPWNPNAVTPALLDASQPLAIDYSPNEQDHVQLHSFRYQADPGRYVYVQVARGMKSFGGYVLADPQEQLLRVPEFPKEIHILHQGSLLALSGAKKLSILTRDLPAIRVQIGRLLPDQLQHVVTQTHGDFSSPEFNNSYSFDESNLTERFSRIIRLPKLAPGAAHYEALDLGEYLQQDGRDRRGIFFVRVQGYDPDSKRVLATGYTRSGEQGDARFIVVTDLGVLVKKAVDGSQDIFVQSIASGEPVAGVTLEVVGRNGEPVLTATSDADGHARFPDLRSFRHERQPVLYLARRGGDTSFLPIDRNDRELDWSRFDVGGVANTADAGRVTAYLFSDRGIYRPGDEIRIGAIVKSIDWNGALAGLPLRITITDPRGSVVKRELRRLSAAGFEEIRYRPLETAPTGDYTVSVALIKDEFREEAIGTISVKVQEFQPDRLRMRAHLSSEVSQGWVSPEDLKAQVDLENLFGTPAQNRRVTATLTLTPSAPAFAAYPDYRFSDPEAATKSFTDRLSDARTDAQGHAAFDLNLKRFARATYRLHFIAEGFEADGGRGVAAETAQLVSNLPYLIGWKADGDLGYVARAASRRVSLIAIGAQAQRVAAKALKLRRVERRYVSVLTQLDNGTYKYVSRRKEITLDERPFEVGDAGAELDLDTSRPGDFSDLVTDANGAQYARIDYTVAGTANLAARLDKNAELKIVLDRKDYAPGDDIALQITAPYTGAGLITVERDKVYAYRWFKTATTSSVQHIRLPQGIEGNAYVAVSFVRDPASPEVFTSPLSYGVQPFSIALDKRRAHITLDAPALVKPGQRLAIHYRSDRPARIVVFAVDEGILQVARYKTPDPLGYFFQKRALDVRTAQILDLILPEFVHDAELAAAGGDAEGAIGRHLNPFKRKTDKPVAYWSGIVDADDRTRELDYEVPDDFNGSLRVMAVAVAADAIGVAQTKTVVRGDFVLSPNVPLMATPGDTFDVSVGVANNLPGSGADAQVAVSVEPSTHLEITGSAQQILKIGAMQESVAHFQVTARDELGSATLRFHAALQGAPDKSATLASTLSVRPATPYRVQLSAGSFTGSSKTVALTRDLYPQYRTLKTGIAVLPLALAHGLSSYLGHYPYSCTEQLASMAMPAIVLGARPEFGYVRKEPGANLSGLIAELRRRQNGDGAYRYWPGGVQVVEFVSLYAQQVLLEARDRGLDVPRDLIDRGNNDLRSIAGRDGDNLAQERDTAYAIYLLTRQGMVMANEAAALQMRLDQRYLPQTDPAHQDWRSDITAAYLASAYQLMKQQRLAERTIARVKLGALDSYDRYHDPMASDAELLYLLARHFPERAKALPAEVFETLVDRVQKGEYQSLSAAETILALDQYATTVGAEAAGKLSITEIAGKNTEAKAAEKKVTERKVTERKLPLPDELLPRVDFDAGSTSLRFGNASDARAFYLIDESGFDRHPPAQAMSNGFEIVREYTDTDGKPVGTVKLGEELVVHVKFRTVKHADIDDGVLVDLLPAGFEVVQPRSEPAAETMQTASPDDARSDDDNDGAGSCGCSFFWSRPSGFPDYADLREDRVVAYGRITSDVQELTYRIRATNIGHYVVPPAYGESMYDRGVQARSVAGAIEVVAP